MKCAKVDCCFEDVKETSPCCICGGQVHHLCSNELYASAELSKRFCSHACVSRYTNNDVELDELTPSSVSDVSASSQATAVDLAQTELNEVFASLQEISVPLAAAPKPLYSIPDSVVHRVPAGSTDSIWTVVHELETPVTHRKKTYTDKWLNHRIDWADIAREQYSDEEECKPVLERLSIRNKLGQRVWNVEQLCQHISVCQWFESCGDKLFPSISKLARVWLGRSSSTAFQERVFSTGSFVMGPLRTRTDNERAQRQLVLRHNRAEIQRMEESERGLW